MRLALAAAFAASAIASSTPASAQVTAISPTQNRLNVTFTGTVTNDVTNTIQIRQPDGSYVPYAGPVPEYPYKQGDQVVISFQAVVPNRNFYSSPAYAGQQAADGIYRIALTSSTPQPTGFLDGTIDISGPARVEPVPAGSTLLRGLTIVYDSNADTYSLELPTSQWSVAPVDAPTYTYDATTGAITNRSSACIGVQCESASLVLSGNQSTAHLGNGISGTIPVADANQPSIAGFFSGLDLSGLFNFSFFSGGSSSGGSSGGVTDVPEPGMMLLFAGGAALLARRRAKQVARAPGGFA